MNGTHVRSIRNTILLLALAVGLAACSERGGVPTAPSATNLQTGHTLPGGAQVRSFDTATCDTVTTSFAFGTEVCAKGTGLGSTADGTLVWIRPDSTVARTTPISAATNGQFRDRYTPDACGTWTLSFTHPGDATPLTSTFAVTGCETEACSPGYWAADQHADDYAAAVAELGGDDFHTLFGLTTLQTGLPAGWTLQDALDNPGGTSPGLNPNNANFVGTGALLSAAHPGVSYPYTEAEIIAAVQAAYGIGTPDVTLDDLAATFAPGHNCPLS